MYIIFVMYVYTRSSITCGVIKYVRKNLKSNLIKQWL